MKKLFTKRVSSLLMVLAMTAALLLPVSASTSKTLKVTVGTPLYLNGLLANTTDISGKANQLFYSDGTTYAPVRAIAEALGQNVTWNSKTHAVEIGTEGNDAANDAAYLQEYFKIAPMSGTVSWTTYTAALDKLGVKDVTVSGTLTPAAAAKSVVALANMTELAGTYTAAEAKAATARYGAISAADAPYVACALQMNLIPGTVKFTAPLTGSTASVILMNAVEAAGKGRNFIGFSSDPDIAARLVSTWNSFTLFDDPTLTELGVAIVKSGATTGYNLKYDGNAARFLTENTLQYGHSDITHAVQLMGLLNRAGLVARVQLEPKVSAYQYLLEWSDGKVPASTPIYQVKQVSDNLYVCFAVEYDLQLEFSSKTDRAAFDKLINTYAKKSDANSTGKGMIAGAWWQPLYSAKDSMPSPAYQQINDVVVRDGAYTIHPFATNEKLDAVKAEITKDAPKLTCTPSQLWVNAAFYRYITGTDHQ
jgi:hypothetical protein